MCSCYISYLFINLFLIEDFKLDVFFDLQFAQEEFQNFHDNNEKTNKKNIERKK